MARLKTTEEFVAEAKLVHGSTCDYSKTQYIGCKQKVIITCPIHGDFDQRPDVHLVGKGCPVCAKKKSNLEEFIEKSNLIHEFKYVYEKTVYTRSDKAVLITCPIHGDFEQTPSNHLKGYGCLRCSTEARFSDTVKFIRSANAVHDNRYDYTKSIYKCAVEKVIITCPDHGDFKQTPNSHLTGQGCPQCGRIKCDTARKYTTEEFVVKAVEVHGDKYDYSRVDYINADSLVTIICPIHGAFEQKPVNHLSGRGCQQCASYGFDTGKAAILYYLKITTEDNQTLYKIGITNRTINERFNLTDLAKIEIIKQKLYDKGTDALNWETKLKRKYKQYQYQGPDILSSGNTELFTEDIIAMWYSD